MSASNTVPHIGVDSALAEAVHRLEHMRLLEARRTWALAVPGGWMVYCENMSHMGAVGTLTATYIADPTHNSFNQNSLTQRDAARMEDSA